MNATKRRTSRTSASITSLMTATSIQVRFMVLIATQRPNATTSPPPILPGSEPSIGSANTSAVNRTGEGILRASRRREATRWPSAQGHPGGDLKKSPSSSECRVRAKAQAAHYFALYMPDKPQELKASAGAQILPPEPASSLWCADDWDQKHAHPHPIPVCKSLRPRPFSPATCTPPLNPPLKTRCRDDPVHSSAAVPQAPVQREPVPPRTFPVHCRKWRDCE